ncbi:hypothetical protein FPV67DRAFT_1413223 [Lyophyllum atratum]|nr:hypothetical protein FPV67DRAFT_1413223 [Lyophyllum atratum]
MKEWREGDRDTFLQELLRLDGRGDYSRLGCRCQGELPAIYRCFDCLHGDLLCKGCVLAWHTRTPLHFIEEWTGSFFRRLKLKDLGLRIQLNHPPGERCSNPLRAPGDKFVIVDTNGVHEVGLDFCNCERGMMNATQLLRARLYPATGTNPRSAATFRCLRQFQLLSFESKCSGYEYISSLSRATDNTGLKEDAAPDRYDEFMHMVHQWRNLKMLKRSGRGHDPAGIAATKPGECALLCPACPQPGINLPPNYEIAPEDKRFLYALFLGIDANFRLKRKNVSSEERDPSLGDGWAFFVNEKAYKSHLAAHWDQKQESDCVAHDAVNKPDREARGLAASGCGTIDCARHDLKRPLGVGDLQFGERYLNMDYLFFGTIRDTKVSMLVVSYDIACQWSKNLRSRMDSYPHEMHISGSVKYMVYLVPKFHLPAHIEECNIKHSFNLTKGVGRTDGEAPERGWANINPIAQSTKEMGPGSRRDTIDDHFNDWNWKKTTQFGQRLLKKIQRAAEGSTEHKNIQRDFEASLPPDDVATWREKVETWEANPDAPNPYAQKMKVVSEREARLKLAEGVAAKEQAGVEEMESGLHATVMIANGLVIEEDQRKLAADTSDLGQHPTANQLSNLLERSNQLRRKIATWIDVQTLFLPEAARERAKLVQRVGPDGVAQTKAYEIALWLPSNLKGNGVVVSEELQEYEWKLREGQANDALEEIRHVLRLRSHLLKHKDRNIRGVRANTRSNVAISNAQTTANRAAARYRIAREALVILSRGREVPGWETSLRVLRPEDVRGLSEGLFGDSFGSSSTSWIWWHYGIEEENGTDPGMSEALCIEWCRARARAMRWTEEVELLQEEMRRVQAFLLWRHEWWKERASRMIGYLDQARADGAAAYALRQASLCLSLQQQFHNDWMEVPHVLQFWADLP